MYGSVIDPQKYAYEIKETEQELDQARERLRLLEEKARLQRIAFRADCEVAELEKALEVARSRARKAYEALDRCSEEVSVGNKRQGEERVAQEKLSLRSPYTSLPCTTTDIREEKPISSTQASLTIASKEAGRIPLWATSQEAKYACTDVCERCGENGLKCIRRGQNGSLVGACLECNQHHWACSLTGSHSIIPMDSLVGNEVMRLKWEVKRLQDTPEYAMAEVERRHRKGIQTRKRR